VLEEYIEKRKMKRKLTIYQYGSEVDGTAPTLYSANDWLEIILSDSSASELSSIGGPQEDTSSSADASFTEQLDLLAKIASELQHRMSDIGMKLPDGLDLPYFIHANLLGEEEAGALDPSLLAEVLTDLQLPSPIISWYWEEAFRSILLVHGFIL
jgi:hypothetical protein